MYRAKNGFTLQDAATPWGWTIREPGDIITALLAFPHFQTVHEAFLWDAIARAVETRKEYADIREFAQYIAENYV